MTRSSEMMKNLNEMADSQAGSIPKFIARGSFGCVYKPPLSCEIPCTDEMCRKGISKLMYKYNAQDEYNRNLEIDKVDPEFNFHLKTPIICENSSKNQELVKDCDIKKEYLSGGLDTLLIYPYGGVDLIEFLNSSESINTEDFLTNFSNIIYGVKTMNRSGLAHIDLKPDNILIDPDTYKFNIIDFGLIDRYEDRYTNRMFQMSYIYWPPDTIVLGYDNVLDINDLSNYINGFQENFRYTNIPKILELTDFKIMIDMLYKTEQAKFFSFNRLDVYSLGIILLYFAVNILRFDRPEFLTPIRKLALKMVDFNPIDRLDINQVITEYDNIIKMIKENPHQVKNMAPVFRKQAPVEEKGFIENILNWFK